MQPQLGFRSNDYMEECRWLVQWSTVVVSSYELWVLLLCRWLYSGQGERCIANLGRDLYLAIRAAGSVNGKGFLSVLRTLPPAATESEEGVLRMALSVKEQVGELV